MFNIGDRVIKIDNNAHGTVIGVRQGRGRVIYTVTFPTGEMTVLEPDLRPDTDLSDPFERCKAGIFGSYSDYAKKNTTFKIKNSNNSTISSLKASKTMFRPYQFKPLLKFLNSPTRRLLVADEVGLGKTIEAGHIMLEMKARKELKNVLIICPTSLQEKWKVELYEKFGLTFKIIEHTQDLIADLKAKTGAVRAIINYEKIQNRRRRNANEENAEEEKNILLSYMQESGQRWSLLLCDEAHRMRNRSTQTYKTAESMMEHVDAALFLTATPIMISEENLYNLLHLLDGVRYFNYDIFRNRLNENRPFVEAISSLNSNVALPEIRDRLLNAEVGVRISSDDREIYSSESRIKDMYEDDPVFKEIDDLLQGDGSLKDKARLQYLLSTMSVMNTIFSRTRKREVTTDMSQAERSPHLCKISLTDEERKYFDKVIKYYIEDNAFIDDDGEEHLGQGGALGLVQRKRQVASSVWGYLNQEQDLDGNWDEWSEYEDSKVNELLKVIEEVFRNGTKKLVVFAVFRKTVKYLRIRLKAAGYNSIIMHGQIDIEKRNELLERFKNDDDCSILLSTEVGSEGLDMQFCNSMVNYDLPWNPMVVEQRIGRIDRFGQRSPVVNIYNFVVEDSIQEEIYERLLDRIGIFRGTIGDMEAILDAEVRIDGRRMTIQDAYNRMEKEFFTKDLTKEEREKKIAEVESAIENEKENLRHLQEGLSDSLTNDAYFRDEINKILHNKTYVTTEELENYLRAAISHYLTTCELEKAEDGILEFRIPLSQPTVLKKFLTQYCDNNDEAAISLNQFKQKIDGKQEFRITFSQEVAYENPSVNFLNIYHPMIQACLNYFMKDEDSNMTTFSFALTADDLLQKECRYYMGIYQLTTSRKVQGIMKRSAELIPVVFNMQTKELEEGPEVTERIYSRSQTEGLERNAKNADIDAEAIDFLCDDFTEYVKKESDRRKDEEMRYIESDRRRNIAQTVEFFTQRMKVYDQMLKNAKDSLEYQSDEQAIGALKGQMEIARMNIEKMKNELNNKINQWKEDIQLSIEPKLISLNLVTII